MRFLRWLGIGFGVLVLLIVGTAVASRFSDGGIAVFPGGPLLAGELHTGPEPDWTFAKDIGEMKLQLLDPLQSRTVWLLVHDKKLYLVSGYMDQPIGRLWKKWPHHAARDGRAVIRLDGKRYERELVRILDDRDLFEVLAAEIQRKYGAPLTAEIAMSGGAWVYAVLPRGAGG